jgi:8-oxo-dGTP diphosphatase
MAVIGYHKVGLLTIRNDRFLVCRKSRGTSLWILPGGCFEPGETAEMCLERELNEELGVSAVSNLEFIGAYRDAAAGDMTKLVQIELYQGMLQGDPAPHAEIAELHWFGPHDDRHQLAPSIARTILPDLIRRGILSWPI